MGVKSPEVDIFKLFRARRTRWEASVPHCPPSSGVGDAESARALLPKALRGFNEVPLRMLRMLGSVKDGCRIDEAPANRGDKITVPASNPASRSPERPNRCRSP